MCVCVCACVVCVCVCKKGACRVCGWVSCVVCVRVLRGVCVCMCVCARARVRGRVLPRKPRKRCWERVRCATQIGCMCGSE